MTGTIETNGTTEGFITGEDDAASVIFGEGVSAAAEVTGEADLKDDEPSGEAITEEDSDDPKEENEAFDGTDDKDESPDDEKAEEEKSTKIIELPRMPEFVGTTISRAVQKLTWERLHLSDGEKKKEPNCYDSLLMMIDPASNDRILRYLISECEKDEGFAERVLLPYKSLKRCIKVFTDTFAEYFKGMIASLPSAKINGSNVPVGCCDDETGFQVIRGYYLIDDKEQIEKEEKEAKEKARQKAEDEKKAAERRRKKDAAGSGSKKNEPAKLEKKHPADIQIDLFSGFGA